MKKLLLFLLTLLSIQVFGQEPKLEMLLFPKYIEGGMYARNGIPYVYRAKITGLKPNKTYRYENNLVTTTTVSDGAGFYLYLLPSANVAPGTAGHTDGNFYRPPLESSKIKNGSPLKGTLVSDYGVLTTDGAGSYTGWFIQETVKTEGMNPGQNLFLRIALNNPDAADPAAIAYKLHSPAADPLTILSMDVDDQGMPGAGTAIRSNAATAGIAKNFVFLYDNVEGTGRPLAGTFIEDDGVAAVKANEFSGLSPFYFNDVNGVSNAWGTMILSDDQKGVRRIEQRSLNDGALAGYNTSADGSWADGANPGGLVSTLSLSLGSGPDGTKAIVLDGTKVTLALPKSPQTVAFTNTFPTTFKVGDPDFILAASSTAGLTAFQYTVAPAGILQLTGSTVKVIGGGTAVITVTEPGNTTFDPASATKTIVVTATPQVITGLPATLAAVYGDANITLSATGGASGNAITYTSDNPAIAEITAVNQVIIKKSGTVLIKANQAGNATYSPAAEVSSSLTIAKANLNVTAEDKLKTHGSANPAATFTYGPFAGADDATAITGTPILSIQADATSAAGVYDILVDVSGLTSDKYTFNPVKGKLTIESKKDQLITLSNLPATATYGDQPLIFQAASNTANPITFTSSNPDIAVVEKDIVGEWTVKVLGAGQVSITALQAEDAIYGPGIASQQLNIATVPLKVIADDKSKLTGENDPVFTVRYEGFVNADEASKLTGTLTFTKQADGAGFLIIPAGLTSTNYAITFVNGKLTEGNVSFSPLHKIYGDAPFDPGAISTSGKPAYTTGNPAIAIVNTAGLLEIKGTGSTTVTATFTSGASGTTTLNVDQKAVVITANPQTRVYAQENPVLSVNYTGLAYGENESVLTAKPQLSTSATPGSAAGTYAINASAAAAANYKFSYQQGVLTVTRAALIVKAEDKSRLYGQENPVFTLAYTGLAAQDNISDLNLKTVVATTATASSAVATYALIPAGLTVTTNYTVSYQPGLLTIKPAPLNIKADDAERGAGQTDPVFTFTYTGFVNGDKAANLTAAPLAVTTATAASGKGVYPITVSNAAAANYTITYTAGQLFIRGLPIITYADLPAVSYGDANLDPAALSNSGVQPVYSSDNLNVAVIENGKVKITGTGTANITASFAASADFVATAVSKPLFVAKRALIVRVDNKTRLYGQANPVLTATYDGFVNGETVASAISAPALLTTVAKPLSPAGTYIISGTGASALNYNISYESAILSIDKAILQVTADNKTRIFGIDNPVFTFKYSGFVNAEGESVIQNPPLATTEAIKSSAAGTYPIVLSGGSAANYSFSYVNGTLSITSTTRTITMDAILTKAVGDADFTPDVMLSSGETPIFSSGDLSIATIADNKVHLVGAGNVMITATAPVNPNYAATPSASRLLVVGKLPQTITFERIPSLQINSTYTLKAVSSAGLPVTFKITSPDYAILTGTELKGLRIGKTQITAIQAGDSRYEAAQMIVQELQITDAAGEAIRVHPALSINGDGVNEFLSIDGIKDFPLNKVTIINRNGLKVFDIEGYDNDQHVFLGKSKSGENLPQGTYFCLIEYQTDSRVKRKTGYFILKY
ncbi:MBG domain-containing protein [Pedobacter cryoconitis]|uniref:CHU domain-containing protein n=1 Tax=Pedobacter cryoconitis TaxID=188932 RepID=A0A327T7C4_9SPHI|nr:MBG domain-containing protein [Pedobacter cryoconitis]RAJ36971.1 CHU domain-containing protein [Pedobacter cryoconitis]